MLSAAGSLCDLQHSVRQSLCLGQTDRQTDRQRPRTLQTVLRDITWLSDFTPVNETHTWFEMKVKSVHLDEYEFGTRLTSSAM
jgi:hypothetical protein